MFSNLASSGRKRRLWSPATVALSVGAHVLLLAGAVYASHGEPREEVTIIPIEPYVVPEAPRETAPPPPAREAEAPPPPQAAAPAAGDFVTPTPPEAIPDRLPEVDLQARPLTQAEVSGIGMRGEGVAPRARVGDGTGPAAGPRVFSAESVEERPRLLNAAEVDRALQRLYPPLLRDAGVTGEVSLELVVDERGRVVPGSVTVLSATHERFAEASLRAAERLRFRPARIGGRAVAIRISLPVAWTLAR